MNKLFISFITSLALLAAGTVMAQESGQEANASGGYSDSTSADAEENDFSDQDLENFVSAQKKINSVRDEYITRIEAADSKEKARELQMEGNERMVTAIEGASIDFETYQAIAEAYEKDPDVRDRVDALM